jgi:hypothetical protein
LKEPIGDSLSSFNRTVRPKCRDNKGDNTRGVRLRYGRIALAAAMTDVITALTDNPFALKLDQRFGMRVDTCLDRPHREKAQEQAVGNHEREYHETGSVIIHEDAPDWHKNEKQHQPIQENAGG